MVVEPFEAIEQYLLAREQEVPQIVEYLADMLYAAAPGVDDFYTDTLTASKPAAVDVGSVHGSPPHVDSQELYNLDQDSQLSNSNYSCSSDEEFTSVCGGSYLASFSNVRECGDSNLTTSLHCPDPVLPLQEAYTGTCEDTASAVDAERQLHYTMLYECQQEVEDVCRQLHIPPDPRRWTSEQVQQWVAWQCTQAQIPVPATFFLPGYQMCALTTDDFRRIAPDCADHLMAKLEIWFYVMQNAVCNYPPQVSQIPVPRCSQPPPSPTCSSPGSFLADDDSTGDEQTSSHQGLFDEDRLPEERLHPHRQTIQLWQFLKLLLEDGGYTDCIRWVDQDLGVFKIENSSRVARLWGKRKNRPAMNYDKLSRSIRQYYKKNIIKKTEHSKRLVYQFCK